MTDTDELTHDAIHLDYFRKCCSKVEGTSAADFVHEGGTPIASEYWADDEPSNAGETESCTMLDLKTRKVSSIPCVKEAYVVCQQWCRWLFYFMHAVYFIFP